MSEQLKQLLDQLAGLQMKRAILEAEMRQLQDDLIPPAIRQQIADVEVEFTPKLEAAQTAIAEIEERIRAGVLSLRDTVAGTHLMAVWSHGRVTWDSKGLDGYLAGHPEIKRWRKQGAPSVSIRQVQVKGGTK